MKFLSVAASGFDSSEIQKAFLLASKLKNPINLSIGFPYANTPNEIKRAAIDAIKKNQTVYTPTSGIPELKEKIFTKLSEVNKIQLASMNSVTVTSGLTFAVAIIYLSVLNQDDEVIVPDPYFPIFKDLCKLTKSKPILLDTYPTFLPNPEIIESLITKRTKILVVNSPNNPTGAIYPKKLILKIAEIAKKYNLLIISDEIYEDFCYDTKHFSIGSIYKDTLTLGGFSKSYAMTGFRIGYIAGPADIIKTINELQQYILFSPSSIAQYAALKAFDVDNSKIIEVHKKRRNLALKMISSEFELNGGNGAFYLFLKCPSKYKNASEFITKAIGENILLLPGIIFSSRNTHFRLSYATSFYDLSRGIRGINALV